MTEEFRLNVSKEELRKLLKKTNLGGYDSLLYPRELSNAQYEATLDEDVARLFNANFIAKYGHPQRVSNIAGVCYCARSCEPHLHAPYVGVLCLHVEEEDHSHCPNPGY